MNAAAGHQPNRVWSLFFIQCRLHRFEDPVLLQQTEGESQSVVDVLPSRFSAEPKAEDGDVGAELIDVEDVLQTITSRNPLLQLERRERFERGRKNVGDQ